MFNLHHLGLNISSFVIGMLVAVGITSTLMPRFDSDSAIKDSVERWAVVEAGIARNDWSYRFHVISPSGEWYIVPKANQEWADGIKEGQVLTRAELPVAIKAWSQPWGLNDDARTRELLRGGQITTKDTHYTKGVYFFVKK